ncbi:MAG: DUF2207 domain-containing protein, partial [Chloroflexota bacterium]|nr:DUF2207 domain-containing protein [Chloroflexota bacterium]
IATDIFPLRRVLVRQIRGAGWEDPNASTWKILIGLLTVVSLALGVCSFGLTAVGENWLSVISAIALFGVAIAGITMFSTYSNFTPAGQEAARPWLAYREGLKAAMEDEGVTLDLDRTLPDAIAMNLGTSVDDRVEGYLERGNTLRAFRSTVVPFPYWAAFHSSVTTAGSSSTVGGSSSSGGGAAGST